MRKIALLLLVSCAGGQAYGPSAVQELLRNAGKVVESFWDQFGSVNCTELVSQTKLGRNGRTIYQQTATYDYLVLMKQVDNELAVAESRVEAKGSRKRNPKAPLLVTNGFPMFLLIFHPRFQHSFEFSQPVETVQDGRAVSEVKFRQIHNAPSPTCLRLRGRDYPLEWAGTAWIEARSGAIIKIQAGLGADTEDLGLKSLTAEVVYAPVQFADSPAPQWLPSAATIEAMTPLQHWKNTHQFTRYKRFAVSTDGPAVETKSRGGANTFERSRDGLVEPGH